jgi:DNA-binding response OmpR family regulator
MAARVLVIDDSQTTLTLIVSSLNAAGVESDSATDLKTVDERLKNASYEVILVDVNMPEMFGDDVLEFLREARNVKGKLLLYSDLPEDELVERTQSSKADGYILKSNGVEAAIAEVQKHLSNGAPAKAAARSRRVLVVDDSEATGKLLEAELKAKGYEVFTAKSAEDGTRLILNKKTRPDLVLLDVRMPGVDGESFCRFIKKNSLFSGIRVILCSAMEETELKQAAIAAGADGYVRKDSVIAAEILAHLS